MTKLDFLIRVGLPVLALVIGAQLRGARRDRRLRDLIPRGKGRISVSPRRRRRSRQQLGHWEVFREPEERG